MITIPDKIFQIVHSHKQTHINNKTTPIKPKEQRNTLMEIQKQEKGKVTHEAHIHTLQENYTKTKRTTKYENENTEIGKEKRKVSHEI